MNDWQGGELTPQIARDTSVGVFAVALSKGLPTAEAAAWGNAAGACSVARAGAQPSLPSLQELGKYLLIA